MKSKKALIIVLALTIMAVFCITGCGGSSEPALEDGTYVATFTTDHSMFHVNEANNNKGIL